MVLPNNRNNSTLKRHKNNSNTSSNHPSKSSNKHVEHQLNKSIIPTEKSVVENEEKMTTGSEMLRELSRRESRGDPTLSHPFVGVELYIYIYIT